MLIIASQCIEMVGVPKIVMSKLSGIIETAFNNNIASIIKTNTMAEAPQFINATSNNPEIYKYIDWLIENAYAMAGISALAASAKKEPGLNSGEAQRVFQDTQSQRFAALERKYQNLFVDLSYIHMDFAKDIADEYGSYTTVYPDKHGSREVDLPKAGLLKDTYLIQCFEESSLPKDPAGRQARLSEMLADGEIDKSEFRRMSNFPDLAQHDQLASALYDRVQHDLDQIIEEGHKGFTPPDEFILDPEDTATRLCVQTINKYAVTDLEDEKKELLQEYYTQVQLLKAKAQPPPPQPMAGPAQPQGQLPVAPPNQSVGPASGAQV